MTGTLTASNSSAVAFPDAFPLTDDHHLIVPRRHVGTLFDLKPEELAALWALVLEVRQDLIAHEDIDGFNLGHNAGEAAGQTISHAHVHLIPRRHGDVEDPRGGVRWIFPTKAAYWKS